MVIKFFNFLILNSVTSVKSRSKKPRSKSISRRCISCCTKKKANNNKKQKKKKKKNKKTALAVIQCKKKIHIQTNSRKKKGKSEKNAKITTRFFLFPLISLVFFFFLYNAYKLSPTHISLKAHKTTNNIAKKKFKSCVGVRTEQKKRFLIVLQNQRKKKVEKKILPFSFFLTKNAPKWIEIHSENTETKT